MDPKAITNLQVGTCGLHSYGSHFNLLPFKQHVMHCNTLLGPSIDIPFLGGGFELSHVKAESGFIQCSLNIVEEIYVHSQHQDIKAVDIFHGHTLRFMNENNLVNMLTVIYDWDFQWPNLCFGMRIKSRISQIIL